MAGAPPPALPPELLLPECAPALFGVLAEGLADRFEPALAAAYARLFSDALASVLPGADAAALLARYQRVRRPRPIAGLPRRVVVLSRVTLGADVAVSSVLMDAARRRFPEAEIVFAGPRKNYELFAGEPRVLHAPLDYRRGNLRERLSVREPLAAIVAGEDTVAIDPDSRLTQLGLLPVGADERYHLFESRGYGGDSGRTLPGLAAEWAGLTFGMADAHPWIALPSAPERGGHIAVSLGVGENQAKRLPDPFEEDLFKLLAATGAPLWVDTGAGGEEAARVRGALERSGARASLWEGSFAGFAAIIASARLYVGYDSAGQHVAAACGVPLISIFAGFPAPRMFERWRPTGERAHAIRVDSPDVAGTLVRVREALAALV
jgi:hypothetical protein